MPQAHLLKPRREAEQQLERQIKEGKKLRDTRIATHQQLEEAKRERKIYTDHNKAMLMAMLDDGDSNKFKLWHIKYDPMHTNPDVDFEEDKRFFKQIVDSQITALEGILRSLDYFPQANPANAAPAQSAGVAPVPSASNKKTFKDNIDEHPLRYAALIAFVMVSITAGLMSWIQSNRIESLSIKCETEKTGMRNDYEAQIRDLKIKISELEKSIK
jgi:hypothetical protein